MTSSERTLSSFFFLLFAHQNEGRATPRILSTHVRPHFRDCWVDRVQCKAEGATVSLPSLSIIKWNQPGSSYWPAISIAEYWWSKPLKLLQTPIWPLELTHFGRVRPTWDCLLPQMLHRDKYWQMLGQYRLPSLAPTSYSHKPNGQRDSMHDNITWSFLVVHRGSPYEKLLAQQIGYMLDLCCKFGFMTTRKQYFLRQSQDQVCRR